jgi:hypothetical protein
LHTQTTLHGPDHPSSLAACNDLARAYVRQGKYDLAGPLLEDILHRRRCALGPNHTGEDGGRKKGGWGEGVRMGRGRRVGGERKKGG